MIFSRKISRPLFIAGYSTLADDIFNNPVSECFRGLIYRVRQVHSSRVIVISDETPEAIGRIEADALATEKRNRLLTVWVADCVPLLLAHEQGPCVAVVHAGWRGLVGGIIRKALEALEQTYGVAPASIMASVGPAIGPCCYEVGNDVAEKIADASDKSVISTRAGLLFADLHGTAKLQLLAAGVQPPNIEILNQCTRCNNELFFSRRAGNLMERQCGFIGILETNKESY